TRDAGDYLHWSGDGSRLHWSLGPELYTLPVADAFDWVDDTERELPALPLTAGVHIGFRAAADRPTGTVAFENARIITMRGDEVIERGTIVVQGNRIAAVGATGSVQVPAGAHRIDATGQTIMPGIVDVHQHGGQGFGDIVP